MYSRTVFEHFRKPRNVRVMPDADGVGRAINEACSDVVELYIKVREDEAGAAIADASFKAQGCVACVAAASMLTELVKDKPVSEALGIDKQALFEALGGLPEGKIECSLISPRALREAVDDYEAKKG